MFTSFASGTTRPDLGNVAICCDREAHVFNPAHTEPAVVAALRHTYWTDVAEAARRGE